MLPDEAGQVTWRTRRLSAANYLSGVLSGLIATGSTSPARKPRGGARLSALAAGLLLLQSCGGATAPDSPARLVLCVVPLAVTVNGANAPTYRWEPACGATYLEVTSPDRSQVLWIVRGDSGKIAPGIQYGLPPAGYTSRFGPLPLVRGTTYLVRVGIMIEEDSFAIFGERAFVY